MLETIKTALRKVIADMKCADCNMNCQRDNHRAIQSTGRKNTIAYAYVRKSGLEIF